MHSEDWETRRAFEQKLQKLIQAELNIHQNWNISVVASFTCISTGWMVAIRYLSEGNSTTYEERLPVKIPEKNLFPSEKMLHFMGQAPLPLKRAKPRDWEEMATAFGKKLAEENRE